MKIAMVSPYDFTWPGGVTAHVVQLARELGRSGHEVQVLAPHSPSREFQDADLLVPLGRSVPLPSGGSIARVSLSWWLYPKVRALLAREQFDIIHLHEPMAPILPLCVLEFSHSVNVGTFHASYARQHLYRFTSPIIKRWQQKLHGNIAVSPAARRYVNNTFPGDYEIIPNGIDFKHFSANVAPLPQYLDGKLNILFVGRLEKRKGLQYLLEAYSKLRWEIPNTRLIVVGPGNPDKESYRILSSHNLQDVDFVGRVSYDDLPRYYASADIFCSPATGAESFGIVLLEAMSAGKPVVASDIEGYRGVVTEGEHGLLVPKKDSNALADALGRLARDPELRSKLGSQGKRSAENYRWEVVAGQVEKYYNTCLQAVNDSSNETTGT
ncbi:MAG: glycosyltransferase family 4 protein [Chloroflexota bacterium]|nr:glycosyltransferase family 4 protein [Chloroflexota bacterium]MED5568922.1 glycosyltransferase family 4 protein [Chloroflexota bacterium]